MQTFGKGVTVPPVAGRRGGMPGEGNYISLYGKTLCKNTESFLWRVAVDARQTLHLQEIQLLVKMTVRKGRHGFVYFGRHFPPKSLSR